MGQTGYSGSSVAPASGSGMFVSKSGMSRMSQSRMSRSGRSDRSKSFGMTQNYISRLSARSQGSACQSQVGGVMTSHGPTEPQEWEPTGNAIQIDEAELAELHRMIQELKNEFKLPTTAPNSSEASVRKIFSSSSSRTP